MSVLLHAVGIIPVTMISAAPHARAQRRHTNPIVPGQTNTRYYYQHNILIFTVKGKSHFLFKYHKTTA